MADKVSKEIRSKNMKAIRGKDTKIELLISKALWKRGYRFRRNVKDLIGKPDIAIKKYKVAIFLDSCFWHCCDIHGRIPEDNHAYWQNKFHYNKKRDTEVNSYYQQNHWHIARFWEHEIKEQPDIVVNRIIQLIEEAKSDLNK